MNDPTADLADLWAAFAETQCKGYSPLYERICRSVSGDRDVLELVRAAPPTAHLPNVLLAAVHYLLLDGVRHPLAEVYAGRSSADAGPLFRQLCLDHRDEVGTLLATRHTQTNECGRSAVVAPGLTWTAHRCGQPLALVDVGASAGLNLLCDRYRLDYGDRGVTGPTRSPVTIRCAILGGEPPIADRLPPITARLGIDRDPVDVLDDDDTRWLLACVWPDTGRLERTSAAIRMACEDPPKVIRGDAVETVPRVLSGLPSDAQPVVLTTWAFAYLSIDQRRAFADALASHGRSRPVVWLSAEGPGVVEELAGQELPDHDGTEPSILGALVYDGGATHAELLGFVQPHGAWLDWRAATGGRWIGRGPTATHVSARATDGRDGAGESSR